MKRLTAHEKARIVWKNDSLRAKYYDLLKERGINWTGNFYIASKKVGKQTYHHATILAAVTIYNANKYSI